MTLPTQWIKESKVSDKQKLDARKVEIELIKHGLDGTYAGGSRCKGHGYWLYWQGYSIGYIGCRKINSLIRKGQLDTLKDKADKSMKIDTLVYA